MREEAIEKYLVGTVSHAGGKALKFNSPSMAGLPDRIVLLPGGVLFFAELKRPGGKARPLQAAAHRVLTRLGFSVYTLDSKELVKEVLQGYGFYTA